jgi:U6 snRNA-associated Sm-like protein LSm4
MNPLALLKAAHGQPMLVELKSGETYNGVLHACDAFMNLCLREVICTSRDGDRFHRVDEVFVRGGNVKYVRVPDEVADAVPQGDDVGGGVAGAGVGARGVSASRGGRGGRGRGRARP